MSAYAALDVGLVVATYGRHSLVETPERVRVLCHGRGKRSELVVGDQVRWQPSGDGGVVEHVEPRRNLLARQDEWRSKSFAANIDQVLVLVAGEPMFSESLLARALVAAEDAGIAVLVLLNKIDLAGPAAAARERLAPYRAMGVAVAEAALAAEPARARALLAPQLGGRTTLVLGPSGMGKSTLVNLMVPDAQAQVGEISVALASGRHTTTATTWYWLPDGDGALIDSPGFQAFGLHRVEPARLATLMPDLRAHLGGCRFYNCTHRHEPGCAVRAAAEAGALAASRWRLYVELFDELERGGR